MFELRYRFSNSLYTAMKGHLSTATLGLAVGLAIALPACDERAFLSLADARPLAVVDGRAITTADLGRRIAELPESQRPKDAAATARVLRELVDREVLAAEVRKRGFGASPAAGAALAAAVAELELEHLAAQLPSIDSISAADIDRYYREHLDRYSTPELRRLAVAYFPSRQLALNARRAPLASSQDLGSVPRPALESNGVVAATGSRVPAVFATAVFELAEVGAVSEPVEHEGRYWLVAYVGRSAAQTRSLASEEANIRRFLMQQRYEAARARFLEDARKNTSIRVDEEVLRTVEVVGDPMAYDPAQWKRP